MKLNALFSGWKKEDGISAASSGMLPALCGAAAIASVMALSTAAEAQSNQGKASNARAPQVSFPDKAAITSDDGVRYNPYRYEDIISRSKLATIEDFVRRHNFGFSVNTVYDKQTITSAEFNPRQAGSGKCEITMDVDQNLEMGDQFEGMTQSESDAFVFIHEQSHCADHVSMFKETREYDAIILMIERYKTSPGRKVIFDHIVSIAEESFADNYAVLTMSANNPASAQEYFDGLKALREGEVIRYRAQKLDNDHDTLMAIKHARAAWDKVSDSGLPEMLNNQETKAEAEQKIARIAAICAIRGLKDYIPRITNLTKGELVDLREIMTDNTSIESVVQGIEKTQRVTLNEWRAVRSASQKQPAP